MLRKFKYTIRLAYLFLILLAPFRYTLATFLYNEIFVAFEKLFDFGHTSSQSSFKITKGAEKLLF